MDFLHYEFRAGPDRTVEVTLDRQANVMLLDDSSFENYRRGAAFRYFGGLAKVSPCRLSPPHYGRWHVVIDLGGGAGTVRAAARLVG